MPDRAHVTSVDAIGAFRTDLIIYLSKARPAVDEVSDDLLRMRGWLQNDQRIFWETQVRRRTRALEDAQQALFSAGIANLRDATSAEQQAVRNARRALAEAEEKLRTLKRWGREFENQMAPLAKQLTRLQSVLANDLPHAIVHLAQVVRTLDAYAGVAVPGGSVSVATGASSEKETSSADASTVAPPKSAPAVPEEKP